MTNEYLSSDFNYKKYSLDQLDNWLSDSLNCEDLTPQDIYDTIVRCVDKNIEYHKNHLTRNTELLSLLKGQRPVDFDYTATGERFPQYDFDDGERSLHQEYNLREAEYYRQRAMLDAKQSQRKP